MFSIDGTDEAIRHFIGLFQLADERGRLRLDYDRLKPVKADPETGPIRLADQGAPHPYIPRDHQPDIPYAPPSPAIEPLAGDPAAHPGAPVALAVWPGHGGVDYPHIAPGAAVPMPGFPALPPAGPLPPPLPVWTLPPPGSIVVIAVQQTALADDDQLDAARMQGGIVAPEQILARLDMLAAQASALGVALPVAMPADEPAFRLIAEGFRQAETPAAGPAEAEVHILRGDAIAGLHQDGQALDARPDLAGLMPEYQRDKATEAKAKAAADAAEAARGVSEDGPSSAGPSVASEEPSAPGSHDLIHGANTLVNQASIVSAAITAPVVVVAAGVYSYNIISQTNVWSDLDSLLDATGAALASVPGGAGGAAGGGATQAFNFASFTTFSNPLPDSDGTGAGEAPQYWVTATLEGSLISCNWIEQVNLMSDNDITSFTLQADQTLLLMGENGAVNQISLAELGYSYDLIIVDGQIINLNAVLQTNVLLDDDRVLVGEGGGVMVSAGDNLLINDTAITQIGQQNIVATTADIDAMLAGAAGGEVTLPQSVLEDPAFRDLPVVRVLHITGDLVSVNILSQTNILADSDQIEVYRDELTAAGGAVEVVAGSNLLLNLASITEFGVDATIYSGGEVYSDALLLQAELISTDDPLAPDPGSGLASEAVLFLAEGMLGDDPEDAVFQPIGADHGISADAMETVLT